LHLSEAEDGADDAGHAVPLVGFGGEASAALSGEGVVPGAAVVLALAPLTAEVAFVFEPVEGGIERALLDDELLARDLLNAEEDAVAVELAERDGFEDEKVEGALEEIGGLLRHGVVLSLIV